jgi:hypothetical protein
MKPFCFVLMPFGVKRDSQARAIDFDAVYREAIAPGVAAADLEPIRADEEQMGGAIHKAMFERLMFCDYAVADVSTANPNVLYELGVRHAVRPHSTLLVFCEETLLPFDLAPLRGIPYRIDARGRVESPSAVVQQLERRLRACREPADDSPVFQLLSHLERPQFDRARAAVFQQQVEHAQGLRQRLRAVRREGLEKIRELESELRDLRDVEPGLKIELFLAYRAIEAYEDMLRLYDRMAPAIRKLRMVQEQRALALNRLHKSDEAEQVLLKLVEREGPNAETSGILGRVYKDRWEQALAAGSPAAAQGFLRKAIDAYLKGFEIDCRDPYAGINALTLMEMQATPDPRRAELVPVLEYVLRRRLASGAATYWDHASALELTVVCREPGRATDALADTLAHLTEPFAAQTTLRNLRLIRAKREAAGEEQGWVLEIERELGAAVGRLGARP